MEGVLIEGVGGSEAGDHVEQCEVLNMQEGFSREGARKEVEGGCRRFGVKSLQLLERESSVD